MQAGPSEQRIPPRSSLQTALLAQVVSRPKSKEEYFAEWDAWARQTNQVSSEKRKKAVKRMKAWLKADRPTAKLDLHSLGLFSLPSLPTSLQRLNVSHNKLPSLPPLPASLQEFDASWNQLTSLPALQALTSLQKLNVPHNKLPSLPPLPASLQEFDASLNQLTSLPALETLTSLRKLHVSHNKLSNLPPLQDLASLQELNVTYNKLSNLPPLPVSLRRLRASYCSLNSMPPLPAELQELDASWNRLTTLPEPLSTIVRNGRRVEHHPLKSIILKSNPIPEEQIQRLRELIGFRPVNRDLFHLVALDESGRTCRR